MGTKRKFTVDRAKDIVDLTSTIEYLEEKLAMYDDGKRWHLKQMNDSRNWDMQYMLHYLEDEDIDAINKYIVKKFRARIRAAKAQLAEYGIAA